MVGEESYRSLGQIESQQQLGQRRGSASGVDVHSVPVGSHADVDVQCSEPCNQTSSVSIHHEDLRVLLDQPDLIVENRDISKPGTWRPILPSDSAIVRIQTDYRTGN